MIKNHKTNFEDKPPQVLKKIVKTTVGLLR